MAGEGGSTDVQLTVVDGGRSAEQVDAPAGRVPDPGLSVGFRHGPLAALRGVLARPLASYYLLLSSSGMLVVIGLVMVFSATSVQSYVKQGNAWSSVSKQAIFCLIGLVAFWVFQRLPAKTYRALGLPLLIASVVLLALLDLLGLLASPARTPRPRASARSTPTRSTTSGSTSGHSNCNPPSWPSWPSPCGPPEYWPPRGPGWHSCGNWRCRSSRSPDWCCSWSGTTTSAPWSAC